MAARAFAPGPRARRTARCWEGRRPAERSAGWPWRSDVSAQASPRVELATVAIAVAAASVPCPERRDTVARSRDVKGSGAARPGAFASLPTADVAGRRYLAFAAQSAWYS